jgi:hypothetical protein
VTFGNLSANHFFFACGGLYASHASTPGGGWYTLPVFDPAHGRPTAMPSASVAATCSSAMRFLAARAYLLWNAAVPAATTTPAAGISGCSGAAGGAAGGGGAGGGAA